MEELFQNTSSFSEIIEDLDFSINYEIGISLPEIVFVKSPPENLHPKIYIYLEFAEALDADAVYFRYYDDNRFCAPQVYFYDNITNNRSKEDIAEIHKKVYSSCQVPAICVIDKKYINIYDVRIPVEAKKETISNQKALFKKTPIKDINILKSYFSARSLNYGIFWESEVASKHFLNNKSAYEVLISELMKIRTELNVLISDKISRGFVDDFLFKCILIKYLEENAKDVSGNYAEKFYEEKGLEYYSLKENIENQKLKELFSCLDIHFNGGVFHLSKDEVKILDELTQDEYYKIAALLDGKIQNQQLSIWEIYSFKHIPIELISNFYEEFIPKNEENKGTVYTPSFLVNFLIDECLPISVNETNYNVKLVDVSCGSGIFISTAFKRLVQRYRVANRKEGTNILDKSSLKLSEIKRVLTENIFGVDKNETAVKLTKFSLQLALCQVVPNNELWNWTEDEVKIFDNLNQNIACEDFFDFLISDKYIRHHGSFDWVIGNPPFVALNDPEYEKYTEKIKEHFTFSIKIPDNQLALMFLEASSMLLKPNADLCFIQKSTPLLYTKGSKDFRGNLFNKFHVHQIIDFTLLKSHLFKSKSKPIIDEFGKPVLDEKGREKKTNSTSVESCAVFYKNEKTENYNISHVVSRLLNTTKNGLCFEFDYYDFFEITKQQAIEDEGVWRCNLLGGRRLNRLIHKLNQKNSYQTTLEDYVLNHLKIEKEAYSEGFMRGTPKGEKSGKNKFCDYIVNKPILNANNFNEDRLPKFNTDQKFYYTPNEKAFLGPIVAIKEQITKSQLLIRNIKNDVAYDSRIVGISLNGIPQNRDLYTILKQNERINALKTIATCSQFFLGSSSVIQKADIDNWMIPLQEDHLALSFSEQIIVDDVLDYIYPSWYGAEKAVINKNHSNIDNIKEYANIFSQAFNAIYKKGDKEQKMKRIIEGNSFFALEFYYSNEEFEITEIQSESEMQKILCNQTSRNAVLNRILRIYGDNTITFVKPKNLRYWLKSIALRDIDDVLEDMLDAGY